jgi:hypothetical protein
MRKAILDGEVMVVEFCEQGRMGNRRMGKTIVFADNDTEVFITIDNFDSFVNLVNMTNDMWYGRGKE